MLVYEIKLNKIAHLHKSLERLLDMMLEKTVQSTFRAGIFWALAIIVDKLLTAQMANWSNNNSNGAIKELSQQQQWQ